MATAKLTLIGLYNHDNTIFDGLQLPDYFDKDTLVNTILLAGGDFSALYPDPDFMKLSIKLWSDKNQRYFEKMAELMQAEYEPLENYYRKESWHDQGESDNTEKSNTSASFTNKTTGTDSSTTENKVSAFNTYEYQNRDSSTTTGSDTETDTGSSSGSGTRTSDGSFDTTREGYARGNIGVMSSQDMWRQQLEIIGLSPYDIIAGDFINEFCIKIYV